jgi:hypothetical protein
MDNNQGAILPTTPPPPPPPDREEPTDEPQAPTPRAPVPPAHAPSRRREEGKHRIPRKPTPPEGTAVVINRTAGKSRPRDGITGITSAVLRAIDIFR